MGRSFLAVALLGLALTAGTAGAGPPGTWTQVTDPRRNIDQIGLARTTDGTLHVAWGKEAAPLQEEIWHTAILPNGTVKKAESTLASGGWHVASDPELLVTPEGGLRVFFGGLGDTNEEGGIQSASAGADGASWTQEPARVSSGVSAAGTVGAALQGGTPVFAWPTGGALLLHLGLNPADADLDYEPSPLCCTGFPDLATDEATGKTTLAYVAFRGDLAGLYVETVGSAIGERTLAPRSLAEFAGRKDFVLPDQRLPLVARGGGGVYLAYCGGYPSCEETLLWRVGSGSPLVVAKGTDIEDVNASRGPGGRIWIMWWDMVTDRIYATRTNRAATKVGGITALKIPRGADHVWKVFGEGSSGTLDLLVSVSSPEPTYWHTQVLPALTLSVKGGKVITCTVTDAGEPVAGAKIKIGKRTLTTNAKGKATVDLPAGSLKASATKAGYAKASAQVNSR